jgi:hypothetical protein
MTLLLAWVGFPLVLGLLSLGCGLLLETVAAVRFHAALLVPAGFALLVVSAQFPTMAESTALLTAPLIAVLAVAGFALTNRWPELRRPDGWPWLAALGGYAAYSAPTVLSGRTTFDGYIKLDDTATYLAMLDRVMSHGRNLANLPLSTYEATLNTSLAYGYPVGSFVPIGIGHELLRRDAAWLWQPYLAFLGALIALALYALATRLIATRWLRAVTAIVAAQPALLYGYALWGGIKELLVACLVSLLAALLPALAVAPQALRGAVPLAVGSAALVGVLSIGGAVWLAPALLAAIAVSFSRRGLGFMLRAAGSFAVSGAVLAIPSIVAATEWLSHSGAFTGDTEIGNLIRPIRWIQTAGIWFNGDFRRDPADPTPMYVLIAVVFIASALGLAWALWQRSWEALAFAATAIGGAGVLWAFGSPWIAGKALASAAPAAVFFALVCVGALVASARRVEGAVLAAAVIGGVLWSNALAYHEVLLAPSSRLGELESIGKRYAGQGPTLMTEFEAYGTRHFLRNMQTEGTSELRRHVIALLDGKPLAPQLYADIDRFQVGGILYYRTLVLRRSPVASAPPSVYRLVERGHWYEVWQRPTAGGPAIAEHLPLGTELQPGAVPSCADVQRLAGNPRTRSLKALQRRAVYTASLASAQRPADWAADAAETGTVNPKSSGTAVVEMRVPRAGSYTLWIGGSFVGRITGLVDGERIGSARHQLEWRGQYVELGTFKLGRGRHRVEIRYALGGLRPGSTGLAPFPLGPVALSPDGPERTITAQPAGAGILCGKRLDWIDAIAS